MEGEEEVRVFKMLKHSLYRRRKRCSQFGLKKKKNKKKNNNKRTRSRTRKRTTTTKEKAAGQEKEDEEQDAGCLTFIVGHLDLAGRPQARPSHGLRWTQREQITATEWRKIHTGRRPVSRPAYLSLSLEGSLRRVHNRQSFDGARMRQAATPATLPS